MFGRLIEYFGRLANLQEAKRCMEDGGYCGAFKSLEDYAYDFFKDSYGDARISFAGTSIMRGWPVN